MKEDLKENFASNGFWKDPNQKRKQDLPWPLEENDKDNPHRWAVHDKKMTCWYKERLMLGNNVVHSIDSHHAVSLNA